MGELRTYQAEITGEFHAFIDIEADSDEAARQIAEDTGCEISDVAYLQDFRVEKVELA